MLKYVFQAYKYIICPLKIPGGGWVEAGAETKIYGGRGGGGGDLCNCTRLLIFTTDKLSENRPL